MIQFKRYNPKAFESIINLSALYLPLEGKLFEEIKISSIEFNGQNDPKNRVEFVLFYLIFLSVNLLVTSSILAEDLLSVPTISNSYQTMIQGLGITLSIFFIGVAIYKYFMQKKLTVDHKRMKLCERLVVTAKTSIMLIEVDGKSLICSVGADRVTILNNIDNNSCDSKLHYLAYSKAEATLTSEKEQLCM